MSVRINNFYVVIWMLFVAFIWFLADWIFRLGYSFYADIFQQLEKFNIFRECFVSEVNVIYLLHFIMIFLLLKKYMRNDENTKNVLFSHSKFVICLILFYALLVSITIFFVNKIYYLYPTEIIGAIFSQIFLIGLCEELVFRKCVSNVLNRTDHNIWVNVIISSLYFALMHLLEQLFYMQSLDYMQILKIVLVPFMLGMMLAIVYECTKNIVITIIMHSSYNIIAVLSVSDYKNIFCAVCIIADIFLCIYIVSRKRKDGIRYEKVNI